MYEVISYDRLNFRLSVRNEVKSVEKRYCKDRICASNEVWLLACPMTRTGKYTCLTGK
uniref:Uncharacterized protein n=1 Tax=Anguilla anguilla TaxID=7936 RepID=A0A0E9PGU9_ANGAN